jgi:pyridoxal phosphate enzyme (YggS family)
LSTADEEEALRERLGALRARVEVAARRAGRDPAAVRIVGAAKRQPAARVAAAVRAGLRDLGENYIQEAVSKQAEIKEILGSDLAGTVRWHGIGHVQTNKARAAALAFDRLHTLDSLRLAAALDREAARAGRVLGALLQVNLSGEPQKSGAAADALPEIVAGLRGFEHVRAVGLMTMPAPDPDPEAARPAFARLQELAEALRARAGGEHLVELSMGMSDDFEVAVEEGATWIRIGTALFGPREE